MHPFHHAWCIRVILMRLWHQRYISKQCFCHHLSAPSNISHLSQYCQTLPFISPTVSSHTLVFTEIPNAPFHLSTEVYLLCSPFYVLCVNLLSQVVYLPYPARNQYFGGFIAPDFSAESNLTSLLHHSVYHRDELNSQQKFLTVYFMADERLQVRGLFIWKWIIQMSIFRMKNRKSLDNSWN